MVKVMIYKVSKHEMEISNEEYDILANINSPRYGGEAWLNTVDKVTRPFGGFGDQEMLYDKGRPVIQGIGVTIVAQGKEILVHI